MCCTVRLLHYHKCLQVDRQWYGVPLYWVRDDAAGLWHPSENWPALPPGVSDPAAARLLLPKAAAVGVHPGQPQQQQQQLVKTIGSSGGGSEDQQVPEAAAAAGDNALQDAGITEAANGKHDVHPIVAATRARLAAAKRSNGSSRPGVSSSCGGAVVAAAAAAAAAGEVLREDVEEALKNCLVLVDVDIPLVALSDGVHARSFAGNGLVVYHGEHLGLVLVSSCCWQTSYFVLCYQCARLQQLAR
jgi:hypothetical protein